MLVKPKCVLEVANFFDFQKFVYILRCLFMIFQKKNTATSQKNFDFINIGSNINSFRDTAI